MSVVYGGSLPPSVVCGVLGVQYNLGQGSLEDTEALLERLRTDSEAAVPLVSACLPGLHMIMVVVGWGC